MTNLEIMEKATSFTTGAYMNAFYKKVENGEMDYYDLERNAIEYSATAIRKVLYASDGMCNDYTRNGNLRYDMASIGGDAIKKELLKNIVNVAVYQRMNDTRAGNELGCNIRSGMTDDGVAVVIFNNMVEHGPERGYEMLSEPGVLSCACWSFAYYRREGKKEVLDNIAKTNNSAMYVNNELDIYYARYVESSKSNST